MNLPNVPAPLRAALYIAVIALSAHSGAASAAETATPPSQVQFGGQCVEGLAEGHHVMTDCATTWTDKAGKVYCFSSDAAKKSFLEHPDENLEARAGFIAASSVESTKRAWRISPAAMPKSW